MNGATTREYRNWGKRKMWTMLFCCNRVVEHFKIINIIVFSANAFDNFHLIAKIVEIFLFLLNEILRYGWIVSN